MLGRGSEGGGTGAPPGAAFSGLHLRETSTRSAPCAPADRSALRSTSSEMRMQIQLSVLLVHKKLCISNSCPVLTRASTSIPDSFSS